MAPEDVAQGLFIMRCLPALAKNLHDRLALQYRRSALLELFAPWLVGFIDTMCALDQGGPGKRVT